MIKQSYEISLVWKMIETELKINIIMGLRGFYYSRSFAPG